MKEYVWLYQGKKIPVVEQSVIATMEKSGIRAACLWNGKENGTLDMQEVLLDERITENGILLEQELLCEVGGKNMHLPAKWEYELALRVAEKEKLVWLSFESFYGTTFFENVRNAMIKGNGALMEQNRREEMRQNAWDSFCVDAYIIARYSDCLAAWGLFETVAEAVLEEGMAVESAEMAGCFMEDMMAHKEQYFYYYDATQPVLICKGTSCCYNLLNIFAENLAEALKEQGYCIEFYDTETEDVQGLAHLIGKRYKALIGFQAWILSAQRRDDKCSLLDRIGGPKYNFIFDHPIWLQEQLKYVPDRYYVLTHDRNYVEFVKKYDRGVKGAYLLPPGGRKPKQTGNERIYDVVFLGTYGNYRTILTSIAEVVPKEKFLAARFLMYMKKFPNSTAEDAFSKTLEYYGMKPDTQEFVELFYRMKTVIQCIMYYYREKVVETILKNGIELHVYGDSWKESPFAQNPFLKIHKAVHGEEAIQVLAQSKISVNIMAWHKDGFTERIADSMLAGAVVVSDYSTQLEEFYGEETVLFDLQRIQELPGLLTELLGDEERRKKIAGKAEKKAHASATWEMRAEELMQIIEEESRVR